MKKAFFPGDFGGAKFLKYYEEELSGKYFRNNLGSDGTIKPLPKNCFGPPHLLYTIRFRPRICSRHVIFFGGKGHRPDKSRLLRPPNVVFDGALYSTFSPQNRTIRSPPPPIFGIIERGVPQAYARACTSSKTLRSVHVVRVFLCIFYIKMGI